VPIDLSKLHAAAKTYYNDLPHPLAPEIKVGDYGAFEQAAKTFMDGKKPQPADVAHIHQSLKHLELSPSDFERLWKTSKPLANRLLNRDPTFEEMKILQEAHPGDIHGYYMDHPHPDFPEVKAGEMAKAYHAATPIARKMVGRNPNAHETARFAIANYSSEDMINHFGGEW
jgi:hypothetical protein